MKKYKIMSLAVLLLIFTAGAFTNTLQAQNKSSKVLRESKEAKTSFIKTDASMKNLFNNSYGYVIFPNIGKGAFIAGGAGGRGTVYEKGKAIGTAKMVQVTVGLQAGGQAYREVIFFENKDALDRFKGDKLEFSGQASAVAVKSGASANAKYNDGVVVFTQERGGLMLEASIGGQKFNFKPF